VFATQSSTYIVYVGKVISLVTMSLCLGFACIMYEDKEGDYGSVYTIQQGLLWQAVPAYAFGLYTPLTANSVLSGTATGALTTIICLCVIFANDRANDPFPTVDKSWATFLAVFLNVVVSVLAHYFVFPEESDKSQDRLTLDKIRGIMKGIREPITYYGGAFVWISFGITIIVTFHWTGVMDPELEAEYGREFAADLMYNGKIRNVIAGVPDWIFATLIWYLLAVGFGVYATMLWDVDTESTAHPKGHHVSQASTAGHSTTDVTSENTEKDAETGGKAIEMANGNTEDNGESVQV